MALISLVIPTYNECQNITHLIRRITFVLGKIMDDFEIIVVDDDSPDGTWQVAEELTKENSHLRVIRRRDERGLATAVVAGWEIAGGEVWGVWMETCSIRPKHCRNCSIQFLTLMQI